MGGFLLLPEDEVALVAHLIEDESLTGLAHDDLAHGPPVAAFRAPLPLPDVPAQLTFWASELGELVASPGTSRLDYARSPIVVWHRSRWHRSGALCAGRLSSQTRRRAEQPEALLALYDRVQAWMKREAIKLDPFDHAPDEVRLERPRGRKRPPVRAFPHAAAWVRGGGPVWPSEPVVMRSG
jgi:hypothetical protein